MNEEGCKHGKMAKVCIVQKRKRGVLVEENMQVKQKKTMNFLGKKNSTECWIVLQCTWNGSMTAADAGQTAGSLSKQFYKFNQPLFYPVGLTITYVQSALISLHLCFHLALWGSFAWQWQWLPEYTICTYPFPPPILLPDTTAGMISVKIKSGFSLLLR